ncbi:MAG: hypothetical protein R3191_02445 [Anaerolineales bacterium]|nr:hypothetical protein [Anaerolineales bacterium]
MRVIEKSEYRDDEGQISLEDRIRGTLAHGFSWYGEMEAQEKFTQRLGRHLDDSYVLLRNANLPYSDITVPLILLGPPGVRAIVPSPAKGIYRAKGDDWYSFNSRSRRFKRTRPNLQSLAISYAEAVHAYLQSQGVPLPDVEPVLVFTNPRTHVDTAQPSVRVVQADAVDHFASNLQKFQPIMDREDVRDLTRLIIDPPPPPEPEEVPEDRDEAAAGDLPQPSDVDAFQLEDSPAARGAGSGRFNFNRSQWIILGLLFLMEIVIVLVFAALIFTDILV